MIYSVCDGTGFSLTPVLWEQFIKDWQLSRHEKESQGDYLVHTGVWC